MSDKFVIESAEDFSKELEFDKFMDEILLTEDVKKKNSKEDEEEEEYGIKKFLNERTDRPQNKIRFGVKK